MNAKPTVLLPLIGRSDKDAGLGIPVPDQNLFGRIIRNPHASSDAPRERECAEMLVAVLLNASMARDSLLEWLAKLIGCERRPWRSADAHVEIETEQSIGGKRDDIRITVHERDALALLWSIEVKVQSGYHDSSALPDAGDTRDVVIQLENYDRCLLVPAQERRPDAVVAGFVLAIHTMQIPPGLCGRWHATTWSHLASRLEGILTIRGLPGTDAFLSKHMLGFIRQHLWRPEEVRMADLELDDLCLIRAFGAMGYECERKVNEAVAPLVGVFGQLLPMASNVKHQKTLFSATTRSVVYGRILPKEPSPYIHAGIVAKGWGDAFAAVSVWIETTPKAKVKTTAREQVDAHIALLQRRNPLWTSYDEGDWRDVSVSVPLQRMLAEADQAGWLQQWTTKALQDLIETGLVAALSTIDGDGATKA